MLENVKNDTNIVNSLIFMVLLSATADAALTAELVPKPG